MPEELNVTEDWKFYSALIEELNERIYLVEKDYANTLDTVLKLKEKQSVLDEYVEVKRGEYYVEIQQATDDIGKPLYKNEELRKIELNNRIKDVPQYQESKSISSQIPQLTAKLDLVKQQLGILIQEKEYRIKFGVEK